MKRAVVGRISAVVLSVLLVFFATELLARYFFPCYREVDCSLHQAEMMLLNSNVLFDPSLDAYSERFGFRLSPNEEQIVEKPEYRHTARTNSLGFRTKEIAPRGANELRSLLLGDSFFYGTGVEEEDMISTWLERLNAEDDSAQYSLIAYNFAVFGYNTVQQLIVAREFVQDIGPHEIVLGLFIGNDILPNAIAYIDGEGNYAVSEERLTRMRNELHSYYPPLLGASVIYRMMARLAVVPRLRYKMASRPEILEETYSLLEELGSLSLANESGFSVVIIYPRDGTAGGFMQRWTRSRVVGNRIRVFCEQNDIRVIDLLDYIEGREDMRRYLYTSDGHFNPAGSRLVAQIIRSNILARRDTATFE